MTKEELKQHCEKQVEACEMWAENRGQEPSGKVYEEHKLILELLEENEDFQKYIDTANHTNSQLIQLIERHKMNKDTSDDCVSRAKALSAIHNLYHLKKWNEENKKYFECEDIIKALPPVTPTRKIGEWEHDKLFGECAYVCSFCHTIWTSSEIQNMHYCPTCGAKMDKKKMKMDFNKSMFDEFTKVMNKVKKGDNESAMIILERKPWGENKHAMVGEISNQITLLEWAIHMLAEGSNISFEEVIKLINMKHENTDHYMLNVYSADIKNQ